MRSGNLIEEKRPSPCKEWKKSENVFVRLFVNRLHHDSIR